MYAEKLAEYVTRYKKAIENGEITPPKEKKEPAKKKTSSKTKESAKKTKTTSKTKKVSTKIEVDENVNSIAL